MSSTLKTKLISPSGGQVERVPVEERVVAAHEP
jgi:hypothetical protein